MKHQTIWRLSPLALAISVALPTHAQTLEEVVVTAQKRVQSTQDIGISVTAFSGDALKDRAINDILGIQEITPNLRVSKGFGQGNPSYSIRGVGELTNTSTVSSSPVAVHINEVPQAYPVTTVNQLFDLERVEVLRGPQGDLFGLNTTGGTINYITAKPTEEFEASALLEQSKYDTTKLEGYVSGPITDTLRARLAVSSNERRKGPQQNVDTGEDFGTFDKTGARLSLNFSPTEALDADLVMHYSKERSQPLMARNIDGYHPNGLSNPFNADPIPPYPTAIDNPWGVRWTSNPHSDPSVTSPFIEREGSGGSLTVRYDIGEVLLTSVTGYDEFNRREFLDYDGLVAQDGYQAFKSDLNSYTQELRLSGEADSLLWMVGANYSRDTLDQTTIFDQPNNHAFPSTAGQAPIQKRLVKAVFTHLEFDVNDDLTVTAGARHTEETRAQTNQGTFLFADSSGVWELFNYYGLNPDIVPGPAPLIQGSMLTDADFTCFSFTGPCTAGTSTFSDKIEDKDWSAKLGVDYRLNEDVLLYASLSRGTKSGGFIDAAASNSASLTSNDNETLVAWEVGAKSEFMDGRMRLNAAAFLYDYQDQQVGDSIVSPYFGPLGAIVNAPKSELIGFELDVKFAVTEQLTVSQSVGYTRGEFKDHASLVGDRVRDDYDDCVNGGGTACVYRDAPEFYDDLSGQKISFPNWQLSGDATYDMAISSDLTLTTSLDYTYESAADYDHTAIANNNYTKLWTPEVLPADIPVMVTPEGLAVTNDTSDLFLLNGRMTLASVDGWEVTVFGRNLLDKTHFTSLGGGFNDSHSAIPAMPRTLGMRLRYDF